MHVHVMYVRTSLHDMYVASGFAQIIELSQGIAIMIQQADMSRPDDGLRHDRGVLLCLAALNAYCRCLARGFIIIFQKPYICHCLLLSPFVPNGKARRGREGGTLRK